MRKASYISLAFLILGAILLGGGLLTYIGKASSSVACEACGMEVSKTDASTFKIISADKTEHYGCCPICAQVIGIYYSDSSVNGKCYSCGKDIVITIQNKSLTSVSPTGKEYSISTIFGGMCIKNKIVCSNICLEAVQRTYDWAKGLPVKTPEQSFEAAKVKLAQFTVGYKPTPTPIITYVVIGSGALLLALAPLSWRLMKKNV